MEKHYDFTRVEKQMQDLWEREQTYRFDKDADGEIYSIDTPPPTVSGALHIGHLFSYTQAEMIARFRRMQGYNVFYPFGFDDNGLPTERLVEREEGIRANMLPRSEFIAKCLETTAKYESEFKAFWNSLGFSVDWSSEYQTISADVRRLSQELFLELANMGKAYTKESPVLWCVECQTSIAQAELDTADVESSFNYIPFYLSGRGSGDLENICNGSSPQQMSNPGNGNDPQEGCFNGLQGVNSTRNEVCPDAVKYIEVATTRPELLFGCVCLFVNPGDERYTEHIGKTVVVPLYDYEIPVLADAKVSVDKGTGAVMCATFGDSTDAEWYEEYRLPYRKVIQPDGKITDDVPFIGGLSITSAQKEIIRLLDERGLLLKSESMIHTVGTHERCGNPIEIIPSKQWYIDILSERERFLKAADEINWYPASMKNRYIAWVENLKWDWCISRQRYFGVPFPAWYCKDCGTPAFAKPEQLPVNPLETEYDGVCACGSREFVPESAVFDTWATSSLTPQINERLGLKLTPMSMRTHAHEIIRTWTFYTIVRSLYHTGDIPWKDLMICGFILAKKGEKVSKSKSNNELDPKNLVAAHSADVLRYWTAGARLGTDTFFSPDELAISKRFVTKLWNASKFAISHLQDFDPAFGDTVPAYSNTDLTTTHTDLTTTHADPTATSADAAATHDDPTTTSADPTKQPDLLPIDRWMIERVNETASSAAALLNEYEIGSARHLIDDLFWKDFCDNYIELVKARLYEPEIHGADERRSGQYALYYALLNILKLYSIYVPHITEYIYQESFRRHESAPSIHLTHWAKPSCVDNEILRFGDEVKSVLFEMRKYKSERNLSMRAEMDSLTITAHSRYADWFRQTEKDLRACSNAAEIRYIHRDNLLITG